MEHFQHPIEMCCYHHGDINPIGPIKPSCRDVYPPFCFFFPIFSDWIERLWRIFHLLSTFHLSTVQYTSFEIRRFPGTHSLCDVQKWWFQSPWDQRFSFNAISCSKWSGQTLNDLNSSTFVTRYAVPFRVKNKQRLVWHQWSAGTASPQCLSCPEEPLLGRTTERLKLTEISKITWQPPGTLPSAP